MCGVTGYLLKSPTSETGLIDRLLAGVRRRGPDDEGVFVACRPTGQTAQGATERSTPGVRARHPQSKALGIAHDVALAHSRYAIIDTSDDAHQPFVSADGDVCAILNGEIYNYVELRALLAAEGISCRTASDTEVLVEGFRAWGDRLWSQLNGFWAVMIYDRRDATLTIARDRMGVAPLYYRETPAGIFISSLIRPLLGVSPETDAPDLASVRGFALSGIKDFGERTCYRDVQSFPPATVLRFKRDAVRCADAELTRFWSLPTARWSERDLTFEEAARGFRERLVRSVELRLRADVPVAFELSGGLDSSSVAACAALLGHPIHAYTVSVPGRDELPFANSVAHSLGFATHPLDAQGEQLIDDLASFTAIMEEPYHSPNVYSSYRMRQDIKRDGYAVVLSGSGGDELLGGYEYECWDAAAAAMWAEGKYGHVARHAFHHYAGTPARLRHSLRDLVGAVKSTLRPAPRADGAHATPAEQHRAAFSDLSFSGRVGFYFDVAHLPYYLRNGDHLTMSIPLEHRFPFLDVHVVEYGAQLPVSYLYRGGWSKAVLREAFRDVLPPDVAFRREKMGFPFPFEAFLSRHAAVLKPHADRARAYLDGGAPIPTWETLQQADPLLLWRLCSTGLWLSRT